MSSRFNRDDRYGGNGRYEGYKGLSRDEGYENPLIYGYNKENIIPKSLSIFFGPPIDKPQLTTCCARCGRSLGACRCCYEERYYYHY